MSWGELSCRNYGKCPDQGLCTPEGCNVDCVYYQSNGNEPNSAAKTKKTTRVKINQRRDALLARSRAGHGTITAEEAKALALAEIRLTASQGGSRAAELKKALDRTIDGPQKKKDLLARAERDKIARSQSAKKKQKSKKSRKDRKKNRG